MWYNIVMEDNNMKKIGIISIIAAAVLALSACGVKSTPDDQTTMLQTDPQTSEERSQEASNSEETTVEDNTAYEEYLNSLQYLEEIEAKFDAANTTLDMNQAIIESRDAWDKELNKIYGLLSEKLSEEQMEELRTVQRQWIKERDQQAEQRAAQYEGGSLYSVTYGNVLFKCTKSRTLELIDIYFDKSADFSFHFETLNDSPDGTESNPSTEQVSFERYNIDEKYYGDGQNYVQLILELPRLSGNYGGISAINEYFEGKEQFFYEQLPLDMLEILDDAAMVQGSSSGYFVSAHYNLETQFGDIISISADLDGGAGGVSWVGLEGNVFNLSTGEKLGLSDLFRVSEEEYLTFIYDYVSKEITNGIQAGTSGYFFADAYSEEGITSIRNFNRDNFYLSKVGLVVFYDKYELADGASGVQIFEIPYDMVRDMLAIDVNK